MLIVKVTNIEEKCPPKKKYCITLLFYSSLLAVIILNYNNKKIHQITVFYRTLTITVCYC